MGKDSIGSLKLNKIYQTDCLKGMELIPDKSIDMILCDLPYGTTQNKWDSIIDIESLWNQYKRIIKDNGAIVLTGQDKFSSQMMLSEPKLHRYNLIWEKSHAVGFLNARRMPLRKHEDIMVFYKKLPKYNPQLEDKPKENIRPITTKNRLTTNYGNFDEGNHRTIPEDKTYPKSIIKISNESKTSTFHPTQKPVALFEYLIKTYTDEGEIVLDNCMGSGTTAVAAIKSNREFIGFEINKEYFTKANQRLKYAMDETVDKNAV
ncbi:DNA-methyltransferase [Chengkuizengella marina]|uniref:Methyltransferase n=1 Tax=Chengkuizengella marina TaxID=2507566 RepID=A0A6N9Q8G7_9BACL|nr:site-specific DNA-methyltransferase [Chengkuizengella marina]NBI30981.1 site-specific DNA-methyltransferase [Chengkuizengella marina]